MKKITKPITNDSGADLLEPPEGGRAHFGALRIYATPVNLVAGAEGYTVPGVTDFEGNVRYYKGKVKVEKSRTVHVVMTLTKTDREGAEYVVAKDMLTGDKSYKRVVLPAMKAVLKDLGKFVNTGNPAFVQVEEIGTGETFMGTDDDGNPTEIERNTWKLVAMYPTAEALKAAADEFFAQFAEEGETTVVVPPGTWTPESWNAVRANVEADMKSVGAEVTSAKWQIPADWLTANL